LSAIAQMRSISAQQLQPSGSSGTSARKLRIAQETAHARQAELQEHATRRADPGSVQSGVVNTHHERIVQQKELIGQQPPDTGSQAADASGKNSNDAASTQAQHTAQSGEFAREQRQRDESVHHEKPKAATRPTFANESATRANGEQFRPVTSPQSAQASIAPASGAGASVQGATATRTSPADVIAQNLTGRMANAVSRSSAVQPVSSGSQSALDTTTTNAKRVAPATGKPAGEQPTETRGQARSEAITRMVETLRMSANQRVSSATMRLDPPELGQLRVHVRMEDDALHVRVEATTQRGLELIASRSAELAAALREHGIHVQHFDVVAAVDTGGDASVEHNATGFHPSVKPEEEQPQRGQGGRDRHDDDRNERHSDTGAADEESSRYVRLSSPQLDLRG